MNVLVLGVGNILLADEGVGVRVVEVLSERYRLPPSVEVVDGGTSGMDLLDIIAGHDHVIIVDAVKGGHPPGTVVRLAGDQVPAFFRTRISPHQLGLSDVLAALAILDTSPRGVTIIGIEPKSLELSLELSPEIGAMMDALVERVVEELVALGCPPHPRLPGAADVSSR